MQHTIILVPLEQHENSLNKNYVLKRQKKTKKNREKIFGNKKEVSVCLRSGMRMNLTEKRHAGSFGGNGNGLYLHCESGYTSVHFYQISPDCAIKMDVFHNTQIIPQ